MAPTTRYSPKREAILKNVKSRFDHPTAAMVYNSVRKAYPDISLGTVYRNLNSLAECGDIISFVSDGVEHFDGDIKPHLHYCCDNCKTICDVRASSELSKMLPALEGFSTREILVVIKGRCKDCL